MACAAVGGAREFTPTPGSGPGAPIAAVASMTHRNSEKCWEAITRSFVCHQRRFTYPPPSDSLSTSKTDQAPVASLLAYSP